MEVQLNTLYVLSRGAVLRRDHLVVQVILDNQIKLSVPIHQLESIAVFGGIRITPPLMQLCAERGIAVSFLTESGRLQARVDAPSSGNVLLRRAQFRCADDPERSRSIAAACIAGKLHNCRNLLLRSARDSASEEDKQLLHSAAARIGESIPKLLLATVESIRGIEGDAARNYFEVFGLMIRTDRVFFAPKGRTRRPPLDATNAVLSFLYALLTNDCTSAAAAVGLDPSVGFLHVDRPGRPGLALDLMEEFRPLLADRLALALINRQQLKPADFETREGGSVEINDSARKVVVSEYQKRKREIVTHPLLKQQSPQGRVPFLQARILARFLRGELPEYVPFIPKN
jgi:CRISPR-associated protein Cas1